MPNLRLRRERALADSLRRARGRTVLSREAVTKKLSSAAQQPSQMILACAFRWAEGRNSPAMSGSQRETLESPSVRRTSDILEKVPRPIPRHAQKPPVVGTEPQAGDRQGMPFEDSSHRLPRRGVVEANHGVLGRRGFASGGDEREGTRRSERDNLVAVPVELLDLSTDISGCDGKAGRFVPRARALIPGAAPRKAGAMPR